MSAEVFLAAGYAAFLTFGAFALEWLSAHTHRRALRYRTAGFSYDADHDHWQCPEGRTAVAARLRSRAAARPLPGAGARLQPLPEQTALHRLKQRQGDLRPLDPWPHSEAGRFHRVIALLLVALSALILLVEVARHHAPTETALLLTLLVVIALAGRWLLRDLRVHPTNFPDPSGSQGLRLGVAISDGERQPR